MKKILIVVDYQYDFASKNGKLSVPNGDTISKKIQKRIDSKNYHSIIYTFDTHTTKEYKKSEEKTLYKFPIHCKFKKIGWELFDIKPENNIKFNFIIDKMDKPFSMISIENEHFFTKDKFSIWEGNENYSNWFEDKFQNDEYEIDIVGVAIEFCVKMNIQGLINRGYKVNLIQDCVMGITEEGISEAMNLFQEISVKFK